MSSALLPVYFDAPLVNPSPQGLFAVTSWQDFGDGEPTRWLPSGVEVRPFNYGREDSAGVWGADWCASSADLDVGDVKAAGDRPDPLDAFGAITSWATDACDLSAPMQAEVRLRAQQNFRLLEPTVVEREFAVRLLDDVGTLDTAADIVAAVAQLEGLFAVSSTTGFIHASAMWAASAAKNMLVVRSGSALKTPLGHTWVFGGGYVEGLADTLVATSPTFGWRGPVSLRDGENYHRNTFYAQVERSLVVGYEALVGAVNVTG